MSEFSCQRLRVIPGGSGRTIEVALQSPTPGSVQVPDYRRAAVHHCVAGVLTRRNIIVIFIRSN